MIGDSFREFSFIASCSCIDVMIVAGLSAASAVGVISNAMYKQEVLRRTWVAKSETERCVIVREVCDLLQKRFRPRVLSALSAHLARRDRVVVVSASPYFYLKRVVQEIHPGVALFSTQVWLADNDLQVDNLYGARKLEPVRALQAEIGADITHVYTDSMSDLSLLKLADRATLVAPSRALLREVRRLGIPFEVIER